MGARPKWWTGDLLPLISNPPGHNCTTCALSDDYSIFQVRDEYRTDYDPDILSEIFLCMFCSLFIFIGLVYHYDQVMLDAFPFLRCFINASQFAHII